MRFLAACAALILGAGAWAQLPDVRVKLDITLSYRTEKEEPAVVKLYSVTGRHSTVGLNAFLEQGFHVFVSEKLEKFSGEVDPEPLEEYYVEDPGSWRVGKQFLPFGTVEILRESVPAARADTNLVFENFPISVAVCDAGSGAQRGIVARLGGRTGLSVAFGDHFGISSTSLNQIRRPEASPGKGHGWGTVFGADFYRRYKQFAFQLEGAYFTHGATRADTDLSLGDASLTWSPTRSRSLTAGWTRVFSDQRDVYRLGASIRLSALLWAEPLIRYSNRRLYDAAFELRFRL